MTYIIVAILVLGFLSDAGGIFGQTVVTCAVCAGGALLINLITEWEFAITIAKICATVGVIAAVIGILMFFFDNK